MRMEENADQLSKFPTVETFSPFGMFEPILSAKLSDLVKAT